MSSEIKACPECQTFILDDASVCPDCNCSLEETPQLADQPKIASVDIPCPQCNEMVAHGSVRCWNCASFMSPKLLATEAAQPEAAETEATQKEATATEAISQPEAPSAAVENNAAPRLADALPTERETTPSGAEPSQDDTDFDLKTSRSDVGSFTAGDADFELVAGVNLLDEAVVARVQPTQGTHATSSPQVDIPELVPVSDTVQDTPSIQVDALPPVQELPPVQDVPPTQDIPPTQAVPPLDDDGVAHSVATGGDLLWQIAMEEESLDQSSANQAAEAESSEIPPIIEADNTAAATEEEEPSNAQAATTDSAQDAPQPVTEDSPNTEEQVEPVAKPKKPLTMLVYCPKGHRVNVPIKFQGRQGRCPKCKEPIFVPAMEGAQSPADETESTTATDSTNPTTDTGTWIRDVRMHSVKPDAVKLKPGSLAADFVNVDVRFGDGELLVVHLVKRKGLFGNAAKQTESTRQTIKQHIADGKPLAGLVDQGHILIGAAGVGKTKVVEPVLYEHESLFKAVPVFGEKQIAIQLASNDSLSSETANGASGIQNFLSFGLTKFREFSTLMASKCGVKDVGLENGVPLTDPTTKHTCHYSEASFEALADSSFHREDAELSLKLVGWRCESCELVVSEDSRKKEKIGGLSGKSISKAKCPKCEERFGNHPLHVIQS